MHSGMDSNMIRDICNPNRLTVNVHQYIVQDYNLIQTGKNLDTK